MNNSCMEVYMNGSTPSLGSGTEFPIRLNCIPYMDKTGSLYD